MSPTCPTNYIGDNSTKKCELCHESCSVCTVPNNANKCSACKTDSFLLGNTCYNLDNCPATYWEDKNSNKCQ